MATGNNRKGQSDVGAGQGITAVAAGYLHTAALTSDGRVTAAGERSADIDDTSAWRDVTALATGSHHMVAVPGDGRVLAAEDNSRGQCDVDGGRRGVGRCSDRLTRSGCARTALSSRRGTMTTASATSVAGSWGLSDRRRPGEAAASMRSAPQ